MIRPWNTLGMGLVVLSLSLGVWQRGWAEEKYTIKAGDTLYGISKSFGVSLEALKNANGLEKNSIRPKQVLIIPPRLHTPTLKIGPMLILPKEKSRLDERGGESGDGEEVPGFFQRGGESAASVTSAPLGKWSHPEERSLLVGVVKIFLGVPYKLGGSTFKGIDCSALVKRIYEVFNIQLPRTTREQFSIGKKIEKDQLEEGDLVFFRERGNRAHVGIYVGDNQFVHASSYSREVKIDFLNTPYYSQRFLRGVRVKELERES